MNTTVSVSMTTFNAGEFLEPQLSSIAAQTRLPDEVVVSDDRSSDGTWERLGELAQQLSVPIRLHRQARTVGVSRNVQQALSLCTGDVVVLADQDDVWHPTKVESLLAAFNDPGTTLWFSNARLVGEHGEELGYTAWDGFYLPEPDRLQIEAGNALRRMLCGTILGATMAVRKSVVTSALPLPSEVGVPKYLGHDEWLAALAYLAGNARADPRLLTDYRQHERQWTAGKTLARALSPEEIKWAGLDNRRRRELIERELRRVHLVAEHVRARDLPCRPERRAELFDLDRFLRVRLLPRSRRGRRVRVLNEFRRGAYRRYARGARTALYDLV